MATIYVIAVPIGCVGDLSTRARECLESVQIIAAEDTRKTKYLLSQLSVNASKIKFLSYHDHNALERSEQILTKMEKDSSINLALVSDAGTPCISDPGFRLIALAHKKNIKVKPIPGVSAITTLISVSGLASDRFLFIGFLPTKKKSFISEVSSWQLYNSSVIFYESAKRVLKSLQAIVLIYPSAKIAIGRELTKTYEEVYCGDVANSIDWLTQKETIKGEFVIMLDVRSNAKNMKNLDMRQEAEEFIKDQLSRDEKLALKDISKHHQRFNLSQKQFYNLILEIKKSK